jgi:hypothetical protein
MIVELIVTGLVGLVVGYASGRVHENSIWAKSLRSQSRPSRGNVSENGDDPIYTCEYHGRSFYDPDEARQHAIEQHGAPRDTDDWRQTYPEGRE